MNRLPGRPSDAREQQLHDGGDDRNHERASERPSEAVDLEVIRQSIGERQAGAR